MTHEDDDDIDGGISVSLPLMVWADVAAALQLYVGHE